MGGKGIHAYCDHDDPKEVKGLFERIAKEQNGRLDILINNAYKAVQYIGKNIGRKFFEYEGEPEFAWDVVNNTGLRNHYICSGWSIMFLVIFGLEKVTVNSESCRNWIYFSPLSTIF